MTPNLNTDSLHISLPQMLDLALGKPDVGAVNLSILHNFLHVLLHLSDLKSTKVEYRGEDANRVKAMISSSVKLEPTLQLQEYKIINSYGKIAYESRKTNNKDIKADIYTVASSMSCQSKTEKVTASAPPSVRNEMSNESITSKSCKLGAKKTRALKQKIGSEVSAEVESVIFVEPLLDGVAPTALAFKKLEQSIEQLQQQFHALEELANNSEMIERIKGKGTDPVTDMWHSINISKRLDASEEGISKLSSMIEDAIKNDKIERLAGGGDIVEQVSQMNKRLSVIEENVKSMSKDAAPDGEENPENDPEYQNPDENDAMAENDDKQEEDVAGSTHGSVARVRSGTVAPTSSASASAKPVPSESVAPVDGVSARQVKSLSVATGKTAEGFCNVDLRLSDEKTNELAQEVLGDVNCCKLRGDMINARACMAELKDEICCLRERIYEMSKYAGADDKSVKDKHAQKCCISPDDSPDDKYVVIKQKQSGLKPARCADLICEVESNLKRSIQCIDNRFQCFEEFVNCSLRNLNDLISQNKSEEELMEYVHAVRLEFEELRKEVVKIQEFQENQEKQNDVFQEEIEILRTTKADKDGLEDALAEKADLCELNKKVSHEEFEAACDDLARGIDEALSKISQLESMLQQSIMELRREFDGKTDDLDIPALKDYISRELQLIKAQLKCLLEMKREQEAAGARKILREMRCISCDKDAFMNTNAKLTVGSQAHAVKSSMHPLLTFKMDQVRQQQKMVKEQGKNLLHLEKIMTDNAQKCKSACIETCDDVMRDQYCNRYCGGSHTVISPQQKVAKPRNCVTDWGAHDLKTVEGFVEGTDGQMYRGRWFDGQNVDKPCPPETTQKNQEKNQDSKKVQEDSQKKTPSNKKSK